jgi:hypothetical protein
MLNVFVVAGALFLIGTVAVYAWLTRKEKPAAVAPLPEQNAVRSRRMREVSIQGVISCGRPFASYS